MSDGCTERTVLMLAGMHSHDLVLLADAVKKLESVGVDVLLRTFGSTVRVAARWGAQALRQNGARRSGSVWMRVEKMPNGVLYLEAVEIARVMVALHVPYDWGVEEATVGEMYARRMRQLQQLVPSN